MVFVSVLKICRRPPPPPLHPVLTSQKNWQFFTCGSKQVRTYLTDTGIIKHTGNESQYERERERETCKLSKLNFDETQGRRNVQVLRNPFKVWGVPDWRGTKSSILLRTFARAPPPT
jgi:hypothetical protein